MAAIDIDIAVQSEGWGDPRGLEALCVTAIQAAADYLEEETGQLFPDPATELSVVFTGDDEIRSLNAGWRDKDSPTNVLSFPAFPVRPGGMPGPMLGDIILAHGTIASEAASLDLPFEAHLTHLLVHGFLHLLGHDHVEDTDAEEMEGLETRILATLGLSDPYGDTDPS